MRNLAILGGLLALSLAAAGQSPLTAREIPKSTDAATSAHQFQSLRTPGGQVLRSVKKLVRELRWHKTLQSAAKEAKKTGKPIVWIHALGALSGYT